jgi:phosphopantothenoylcysteine decarboxylase/phosphopantothenate--cysteine ligase
MATQRSVAHIILGVTGSIAAYKAGDLIRRLQDAEYSVSVVMTKEAESFISPLTLEALSGNRVAGDMFLGSSVSWQMEHVKLAEQADLLLIAPATAHILAKLANGFADDLICSTALASLAPKLIAPAMNTNMYRHPVTQDNIKRLKEIGYHFIGPIEGRLACGTTGPGHLADIMTIVEAVNTILK